MVINLVFPTNFSKNTRTVITGFLKQYIKTDWAQSTKINLLHAYDTPHVGQHMMVDLDEKLEENAIEDLEREARLLREGVPLPEDMEIELYARKGNLINVMHKFDNEQEIDLAVVALKSSSFFTKILSDSSPSHLVNSLDEPVLFVPDTAVLNQIDNIVFAIDLKPFENTKEVKIFIQAAAKLQAHVDFVYVEQELNDSAEEKFHQIFDSLLEGSNLDYSFRNIIADSPKEGIVSYAQEHQDHDLVVLIERKESFLHNLFGSNLADEIASLRELPLLVISEEYDEEEE